MRSQSVRVFVGRLLIVVGFGVAWDLAVRVGWMNEAFTSRPTAFLPLIPEMVLEARVQAALAATLFQVTVAFFGGAVAGIFVGVALGLSRSLRDAYHGPLLFFLSVPKSAFLPVFILLFGIGQNAAIAFGIFSAFFYVVVNVVAGVDLVENRHRRVARAFRANRWQTFADVVLPVALPSIVSGLWHGTRHAMSGVIIAQLFVAAAGVGLLYKLYSTSFNIDAMMALTLIIAVGAILIGSVWSQVDERLGRWRSTRLTMADDTGA